MKSYALDHPKLPPILLDLFFYLFPEFSYLFVGVLPASASSSMHSWLLARRTGNSSLRTRLRQAIDMDD